MARPLLLLNARSGTVIDQFGETPEALARQRLDEAGVDVDLHLVQPADLIAELELAARSSRPAVLVGGGDGTVNAAFAAFVGHDSPPLGVLPLGTMNLLGRGLGIPEDFAAAARALLEGEPSLIDVGRVNGRAFHTLVGLGYLSQLARQREKARGHWLGRSVGFVQAVARALRRSGRLRLTFSTDTGEKAISAWAVMVTNNRFSGTEWRRPRLDEGVLELHVGKARNVLDFMLTGIELAIGDWRESSAIESHTMRSFRLSSARKRVWASIDGELVRLDTPLDFAIEPKALRLLLPRPGSPDAVPSETPDEELSLSDAVDSRSG